MRIYSHRSHRSLQIALKTWCNGVKIILSFVLGYHSEDMVNKFKKYTDCGKETTAPAAEQVNPVDGLADQMAGLSRVSWTLHAYCWMTFNQVVFVPLKSLLFYNYWLQVMLVWS